MLKEQEPKTLYGQRTYRWENYEGSTITQVDVGNVASWKTGRNRIEYSTNPPLYGGKWPWNTCTHYREHAVNPYLGTCFWDRYEPRGGYGTRCLSHIYDMDIAAPALPQGSYNANAPLGVLDQLDLNSRENVLLYSGIVQAIPLLGSVLKLNSICRKIIKNTSKSFRRKPFTTVIKSLISADFIDRFVISPTLDDAKRFQDACDYTLRVMQTLRDRHEHITPLSHEYREVLTESSGTKAVGIPGRNSSVNCSYVKRTELISKAFCIMEVRYNMTAVAPLKVYAQRVGLSRPLDSIWDLVPFSFVADYFFRSGDFVQEVSDRMSEVEGLKGKIARIYDLWGSFERKSSYRQTVTGFGVRPTFSWGEWAVAPTLRPSVGVASRSYYSRFRIPDPMAYFNSLWQPSESWGSINFDLSLTRKRTLAELFIQAKLRP